MRQRKKTSIHDKGLAFGEDEVVTNENGEFEFSKMRVGIKTLQDAVLDIGTYKKTNNQFGNKEYILKAINAQDYASLGEISKFYYVSNGIYQRLCKYLAYLYKYDWILTPQINGKNNQNKIIKDYYNALNYLENSEIKRIFGDIALEVIVCGSYYGYALELDNYFSIQQLPSKYCRSRYNKGPKPVVEFNLKYFDDTFRDVEYRIRVLSMFPKEIQKGYALYLEKKLKPDIQGDESSWIMLDPDLSFKFNIGNSLYPVLIGVIPSLIDLDLAQELDRKKAMQQLLKIIIQKLPLDKNNDLIFDVDEARDIHNNAVSMLKRAIGVDVLTTFADVEVANMRDSASINGIDELQKAERTVYNNSGVAQNVFNTEGSIALEKSVLNDEASIRDLILQFKAFLNGIINYKFKNKNYSFIVDILETTIYNYKDISKLYKEQTQIGYSKLLPPIALGISQSTVLNALTFENDYLKLNNKMIPPLMSSTRSDKSDSTTSTSEVGRPEKEEGQKSDKTIQNLEAQG